jgi:hypothetical protein
MTQAARGESHGRRGKLRCAGASPASRRFQCNMVNSGQVSCDKVRPIANTKYNVSGYC